MDSITNELRRKYSHLTKHERGIIQSKLRAGCSLRGIAREIGCAVNTVRNEIKRGLTPICNGTRFRYYMLNMVKLRMNTIGRTVDEDVLHL